MEQCSTCGRTFNTDALARHVPICQKSQKKTRKVFDSRQQRIRGTDIEQYLKTTRKSLPTSTQPSAGRQKTLSWRQKHDDFIQTVRAARQINEAAKSGAPLPAPVPSAPNPDYVQCSYCQRHFEPNTAERHIPFCKQASKVQKTPAPVKATESLHKRIHYKPPSLKKKSTPSSHNSTPQDHGSSSRPVGSSVVRQNTNFGSTYTFTNPPYTNSSGHTPHQRDITGKPSSANKKIATKKQSAIKQEVPSIRTGSSVKATSFSRVSEIQQPSYVPPTLIEEKNSHNGHSQARQKDHHSASRRLFAALEYSDCSSDEGGNHQHSNGSSSNGHQRDRYSSNGGGSYHQSSRGKVTSAVFKEPVLSGQSSIQDFDSAYTKSYSVSSYGGMAMASKSDSISSTDSILNVMKAPTSTAIPLNEHGMTMSKFCYECGTKFPVPQAKYCCECGTKRI